MFCHRCPRLWTGHRLRRGTFSSKLWEDKRNWMKLPRCDPVGRGTRRKMQNTDYDGSASDGWIFGHGFDSHRFHHRIHNLGGFYRLDCGYLLLSVFRSSQRIPLPFLHKSVRGRRLLLMVRYPGNHEFPDHEKNGLDSDFLLLMGCSFIHEFPFFKIKQQAGNCFTRYLQRREQQFPEKQFLCLLGNHNGCGAWILKHLQ